MPIPQLFAADLALLRQYDTPTICNVIELLDVQSRTAGYIDGRILACFPEMPPIAGSAATATISLCVPAKRRRRFTARSTGCAASAFRRSVTR